MKQERLEKIIVMARYGIITAIGFATLGAALFSGCSGDFSKKNEPKAPSEKKEEDPRLVYGPVLFDPRINMGLPSSESIYEELSKQDADQARSRLQTTTNYRTPIQPFERRSQLPITSGYQAQPQPLQPIQTPRTDGYQLKVISPSYQNNQRSEDIGRKEH